jgi:hypothetical protein
MSSKTKNLVFTFLFGYAGCIIIGYLFYGSSIFLFHYSNSVIIVYGFFGAAFYSVLKNRGAKDQVLTGIASLILITVLLGRAIHLRTVIINIVFMSGLFASIISYKLFIDKYIAIPLFLRSFALALFLGLFDLIATIFLILIISTAAVKINIIFNINTQHGTIIGFGLGLGFDLYELTKNKLFLNENLNVS